MPRSALVSLLAVALLAGPAAAAPVRPADDAEILASVPAGLGGGTGFRAAEAAHRAAPDDLDAAVAFARAAVEEGRTRSDPRFYGRAAAALAPWSAATDAPRDVRILRAVIAQAGHDFAAARAALDVLIGENPADLQARLSRASIRMVTGDGAGAAEDCAAVRDPRALLPATVCRARAAALVGQAEAGLAALRRAMSAVGTADPAQRRFAALVEAELLASLGRPEEAERVLAADAAGAGVPDLAARADLLLDLDRPDEVLALLDGHGDADVLLLARLRAAVALDDTRAADWTRLLSDRFAAAAEAGVALHRREEARFRLSVTGDAAGALALARDNWAVQKEVADTRLLLEAALAAGDPSAAEPALRHIRNTGLDDARLRPLVTRLQGENS